jgi:outer membrane protein assembly factor BamD
LKLGRTIWLAVFAATLFTGCLGKKNTAPVAGTSAEPDKVLYEKSASDMKHGRYTVGRLGMQTLINTYPDSEYLAKAKLAIGDSYYKEGGTAGLKQSVVEYKDFITFFPFLDEAAYAQLQIGMAHYHMMEKPDRDRAETVQAEAELQTFLEKYPNSPLYSQAEQHLREVQEVLAEGNFRVARFYFMRQSYKAAGARLIELTNRYPYYSQADEANWMLGQIYEKAERNDIAAKYYGRIAKEYPLSRYTADSKAKLTKFGVPIPPPDAAALARMEKNQHEVAKARPGIIKRSTEILKNGPDISTAARVGAPTMTPASESGDETLIFNPLGSGVNAGSGGGTSNSATVETITPGSSQSLGGPTPPAAASSDASGAAADSSASPSPDASSQSAADGSGTAGDAGAAQPATPQTPAAPADKSQESTSKKKKGIHKVLPF